MKNVIIILLGFGFFFSSCDTSCRKIKKPANLQLVDKENYNDVYTVYWNYFQYCNTGNTGEGDTVMICGWRPWYYDSFYLVDDPKYTSDEVLPNHSTPHVHIEYYHDEIAQKLSAVADWEKKIFIKGVVELNCLHTMSKCDHMAVNVFVEKPEDIYFEE